MKHLRLMPLLIAAVFLTPRAHAATIEPGNEAPSGGVMLLGISLLLLTGRPTGSEPFRNQRPR